MSRLLFSCTLYGKPVPQGRARVGRWNTYYPKTSKAYRKRLVAALRSDVFACLYLCPLSAPVEVHVLVAGARANSDLDNYAKMALDALQDAGVLASDDVRTVVDLRARVTDGEPRMEVRIFTADAVPVEKRAKQPRKPRAKKETKR